MKVILRKKIDKLGKDRDIVFVKDGFARNFLLPKGLALIATKDNINKIEQEKRKLEHNKEIEKNKAKELADKLQGFSCTITVEAKDDNLYGSITAVEISKALKDEQLNIDKTDILLEEPIEKLGIYEVEVRLHPEVTIKIKVWVVKS
ncbi:50S ribosomal protein L9 [bacterium]|nr:50S ribosomal protein L9 [bacterium]